MIYDFRSFALFKPNSFKSTYFTTWNDPTSHQTYINNQPFRNVYLQCHILPEEEHFLSHPLQVDPDEVNKI